MTAARQRSKAAIRAFLRRRTSKRCTCGLELGVIGSPQQRELAAIAENRGNFGGVRHQTELGVAQERYRQSYKARVSAQNCTIDGRASEPCKPLLKARATTP